MGTAGPGLVLGGLLVFGRGCLPWCCRALCPGACWCVVLRVCPAWPACGARSLPGRAVAQARGHTPSLAVPYGSVVGSVGARLLPGAQQWGVCTMGGGLALPVSWCAVSCARCPGPLGSGSPVCTLCVRCPVHGDLGHLAPVQRCARSVCDVVRAASWATWLLFTVVLARCVRCPGPLGSCSPARAFAVRCCACLVSWASWLLFTGVLVPCVVRCVRCCQPPGSCSPVCLFGALCGVRGGPGLVAPVHRCGRSACGVVCMVPWASWLLLTAVFGWRVVWCVWCPWPRGSCSPVCTLGVQCFVHAVLGLLAPVHRCACVVCCVVCAVSWATLLPSTGVPVWRVFCCVCGVLGLVALVPRCAVCLFGVLCVVCGVLGHVAPVHRCACSACWVVCVVWVWVCVRVCHTVLVAFFVAPKGRRCWCTPPGLLCALRTYAIWSLRCGIFVFGNAQE